MGFNIKNASVLISDKTSLKEEWFHLSEYGNYEEFVKGVYNALKVTPEFWSYDVYLDIPAYISDVNDIREYFVLRERLKENALNEEAFWAYVDTFSNYPDVSIIDYCFDTFNKAYVGIFKSEELFASYYVHEVYKKEMKQLPKIIKDSIDYRELAILLFSQEGYVYNEGFVFKRLKNN